LTGAVDVDRENGIRDEEEGEEARDYDPCVKTPAKKTRFVFVFAAWLSRDPVLLMRG
jgi:hypothetical protein